MFALTNIMRYKILKYSKSLTEYVYHVTISFLITEQIHFSSLTQVLDKTLYH